MTHTAVGGITISSCSTVAITVAVTVTIATIDATIDATNIAIIATTVRYRFWQAC